MDDLFLKPTFSELKIEAARAFGDFGAWVYDEWRRLNNALFYGNNTAGAIIWEETPQSRSLGYYEPAANRIVLHKTLMRPVYPTTGLTWEPRRLNTKMMSDVLLHEMIHQRIHQTGGWMGENSHNNERFVNEVNRIAKLLGLNLTAGVIGSKNFQHKKIPLVTSECLSLKELFHFPYLSRSRNYYYEQP
jgi:hypothetical protein